MAIGIGNPAGARIIHTGAIRRGYGPCIREAGDVILKKLPVAFALAVTENWKHETDYVEEINLMKKYQKIHQAWSAHGNNRCPCGSGKNWDKCHGKSDE